jgi:hypothetical protein
MLGGAIIGGILAAPYYGSVPYYGPGYGGNAVSYCMQGSPPQRAIAFPLP